MSTISDPVIERQGWGHGLAWSHLIANLPGPTLRRLNASQRAKNAPYWARQNRRWGSSKDTHYAPRIGETHNLWRDPASSTLKRVMRHEMIQGLQKCEPMKMPRVAQA